MIGIVIPVRDGAPHLRRALDAVTEQVGEVDLAADVVVVDGGSRDDSADLARSVPGVRVIAQHGTGLAAGRNQGVAALDPACDLLAFCDSDDRWAPGSLRLRVEHLRRRPATAAVIGAVTRRPLPGEQVPDATRDRLGVPAPGYTPGALIVRRAAFDHLGGFDESLHIGADSDWFIRLAQSDLTLDQLGDVVLEKGVRATSLSTDVEAYRQELLRVARAYVRRVRTARPVPGEER